jgi:hypothetical protein
MTAVAREAARVRIRRRHPVPVQRLIEHGERLGHDLLGALAGLCSHGAASASPTRLGGDHRRARDVDRRRLGPARRARPRPSAGARRLRGLDHQHVVGRISRRSGAARSGRRPARAGRRTPTGRT